MNKLRSIVRKTLVRIVINGKHQWIKPDGSQAPFDCDYKGAIKKGYGMSRNKATAIIDDLAQQAASQKISAVVIFYEDPRL